MTEEKKQPSKVAKVFGIVGAWLTLPIFGVFMLWFTSTIAEAVASNNGSQGTAAPLIINGLIGILILLIVLIACWPIRKKSFFFQFIIGLWIGIGLYALLLFGGIQAYYSTKTDVIASNTCTTPIEKYRQFGSAVVPIETDTGYGTGFIVDANGLVLTANHVVQDTATQFANYASGKVKLTIVDQAPEYDLAILKLEKYESNFFPLSSIYQDGDDVLTYGYPGNAYTAGAPSISKGIVSRILTTSDLRMTNSSTPEGYELIQTDAAINSGNSGGPLIGACGVIGIVVSVSDSAQLSDYVGAVSEQGIGYAMSAKVASERFNIPLASSK